MTLELSKVKKLLQDHLQEGLLLIVGSGLSIAEGIPGMWSLAEHLKKKISSEFVPELDPAWHEVIGALDEGDHIEAAMSKVMLNESTIKAIIQETALFISAKEREIFGRVLSGQRVLPFTTFAKHLFKAGRKFHLITPNYDRLVELATEVAEIGVDSRFFGYLHGRSDPKRSADSHRESVLGKNPYFRSLPCLCVYKPHGSLDWFDVGEKIVRCPMDVGTVPLIITPGTSKYRKSFRSAFDDQRSSGNRAATKANRLMFIGYGFNDDHLEEYLCPGLKLAKPSLILTKELSDNARRVVENSRGIDVTALCAVSNDDLRTRIVTSAGEEIIVDEQLWNLEGFNKGVL